MKFQPLLLHSNQLEEERKKEDILLPFNNTSQRLYTLLFTSYIVTKPYLNAREAFDCILLRKMREVGG